MSPWEDTVKVALVGSERQSLALVLPTGSRLGGLLSQLQPDPAEPYVLQVAGVLSAYRRASWSPSAQTLTQPDPCDLDDLPRCSGRSSQLLNMILAGSHREVLPEWLGLAAQAQQRVPEELLPALLDQGRQSIALRDRILPVLGKRGRWLAAHNKAWNYVYDELTGNHDETIWLTGSAQQRLALLKQVSQQDPQQTRQWIQSTWKTDQAEFRVSCLQVLATILASEDEVWLEEILSKDRSKQVRTEATELLSRLPGSAFRQRMYAQVELLLQLDQSKGKPLLEVTLPTEFTPEMERDGLVRKPLSRMGEKAWWLQQMIARVPPKTWCDRWQLTPEQLLEVVDPQWHELLHQAWSEATFRFTDQEWAEALILKEVPGSGNLATILSGDRIQALCLQILDADPAALFTAPILLPLLSSCQTPWSLSLTERFVASCGHEADLARITLNYSLRSSLLSFANVIPPEHRKAIASDLLEAFAKQMYWLPVIEEFLDRLEFRQQIHQSFP